MTVLINGQDLSNTDVADILDETEVIEHHLHPQMSVTTPNGSRRRGAITFGAAAANTETVTIGYVGTTIVYTFKAALGADPGAGKVTILVQATADLTARKLSAAMQGETDAVNILYGNGGVGTKPHPNMNGFYTSQRYDIGTVIHPAGATVCVRGITRDAVDVITLSDTVSHAGTYPLTAATRIYSARYVMSGNAAALINRIAGPYQCVIPMNSVRNTFESPYNTQYSPLCKYDVGKVIIEGISDQAMIVECDGYYSSDEVTFTELWHALELSREPASNGSQMYPVNAGRIPAGAGFYLKMRSNLTAVNEWVDYKAQYHFYPSTL